MAVTRKTISVAWLAENNACNLEVCREYFSKLAGPGFTDQTEFELTPEGILKASGGRVLSTNWLARRILTGEELKEYEQEMNKAMQIFERRMAPVLAAIVARSKKPPA
jgi:hypothetical protein